MIEGDKQEAYRLAIDNLRIENDAKFGIVSKRVKTPEGDIWVRDATETFDLNDSRRPSHDAVTIEANNTRLRMLTRLRPIDYMLSKQTSCNAANNLRNHLCEKFEQLSARLQSADTTKSLDEIETEFNTFLIKKLHEAHLTQGCSTKKDAEALLAHYKILYSVLDPAMPMVTLTYDEGTRTIQRETQYPVTEKTPFQKSYEEVLKQINPYPLLNDEMNAHTVHNEAKQYADRCFADLIVADDRMLTSQARKTHVVGVKNAFIVKVETERAFDLGGAERMRKALVDAPLSWMDDNNPLMLGRMAVPVYVGKGEKNADRSHAHVKANLEQLTIAAKKYMPRSESLKIHLTTLNTYTNIDGEKQNVMIDGLRKAMAGTTSEVSVVPTNEMGMLYRPQLAESIHQQGEIQFGKKADRLDFAVNVALEAHEQAETLSFVNCAGGADRTGTLIEKLIQRHTAQKMKIEEPRVEAMRARGFNSAEIIHQMVPGTPGMKPSLKANNAFGWGRQTFSDRAAREFYLKAGELNKINKVNDVSFLKVPSQGVLQEYKASQAILQKELQAMNQENVCSAMKKAGEKILKKSQNTSHFKSQDYVHLSEIYKLVAQIVQRLSLELDEANLTAIALDLNKIDNMQRLFSKEKVLKKKLQSFLIAAVVSIAAIILLSAPWFNSILFVAGMALAVSSIKLSACLELFHNMAWQLILMSSGSGSVKEAPKHGVLEKTREFSKAGHAFFKAEEKKIDVKVDVKKDDDPASDASPFMD